MRPRSRWRGPASAGRWRSRKHRSKSALTVSSSAASGSERVIALPRALIDDLSGVPLPVVAALSEWQDGPPTRLVDAAECGERARVCGLLGRSVRADRCSDRVVGSRRSGLGESQRGRRGTHAPSRNLARPRHPPLGAMKLGASGSSGHSGAVVGARTSADRAQSNRKASWPGAGERPGPRAGGARDPAAAASGSLASDALDRFGLGGDFHQAHRPLASWAGEDVDREHPLEQPRPGVARGGRWRRRQRAWLGLEEEHELRLGRGLRGGLRDDARARLRVRGEHAVIPHQVKARRRDEGAKPGKEVERLEQDRVGPIFPRRLEPMRTRPSSCNSTRSCASGGRAT